MHRLAQRNPNVLNSCNRIRRPFLDFSDDDNNDSTYIDTDDEVNYTDKSDNDPPLVHNATSEAAGVTAADLRNLR